MSSTQGLDVPRSLPNGSILRRTVAPVMASTATDIVPCRSPARNFTPPVVRIATVRPAKE
ncbi:hypothetical protein [Streptomyces sp. NBC_00872]|uniref:hypothetical protein n=1 Tax=Streptomyces sp. NBC_00872 TaxID=2903686 RepID=UPI0038664000|nr:hypothetical protein OG214_33540 [Streptomyces sp. NBC_00872]